MRVVRFGGPTLGRSHVHTQNADTTTSDGYEHTGEWRPLGLSLAQHSEAAYRVAAWRIVGSIGTKGSYDPAHVTVTPSSFAFNGNADGDEWIANTDPGRHLWTSVGTRGTIQPDDYPPIYFYSSVSVEWGPDVTTAGPGGAGYQFSPLLHVEVQAGIFGGGARSDSLSRTIDPVPAPRSTFECIFRIGGEDFEIPMFRMYAGEFQYLDCEGSMVIEPFHWLSYAKSGLQPVYDTADGARLITPLPTTTES